MKAWFLPTDLAYLHSHLVLMGFTVFPQGTLSFPCSRGHSALPDRLRFIASQKANSNSHTYPPRLARLLQARLRATLPLLAARHRPRAPGRSCARVISPFGLGDGTQRVLVSPLRYRGDTFPTVELLLAGAGRKLQRLQQLCAGPGLGPPSARPPAPASGAPEPRGPGIPPAAPRRADSCLRTAVSPACGLRARRAPPRKWR